MENNIISAVFVRRNSKTRAAYQYDYGQILKLSGLNLPMAYEVHFSNDRTGESTTSIGDENGVVIPDQYFLPGTEIYFWLFLHEGADDGETRYEGIIPIIQRARPTDIEPTPVQQDVITQTIAALNEAVEQTGEDRQTTAEYAQNAAVSEANAAESERNAENYMNAAGQSAVDAEASAGRAETAEQNAATSASNAAESERGAQYWEDMAEQVAAQSGYMWFYIENGQLFMDRTPNTQVDFYIENGQLFVTEVA